MRTGLKVGTNKPVGSCSHLSLSVTNKSTIVLTWINGDKSALGPHGAEAVNAADFIPMTNYNGVHIFRSRDNVNWHRCGEVASGISTFTDTGLEESVRYYYKVAAFKTLGPVYSNYTDVVSSYTALTAPATLEASSVTKDSMTLTWADSSLGETGFELYQSNDNTAWTLVDTFDPNVVTTDIDSLEEGVTYYFRVRAIKGDEESSYTTLTQATVLTAPTGLTLTPTNPEISRIVLDWTDNSTGEAAFQIYRSTDDVTFTLIHTTDAGVETYNNTELTEGVRYYYKVRGVKDIVYSTYITGNEATLLTAPTIGSLTVQSDTEIDVAWTDNSGTETEFEIARALTDNPTVVVGDAAAAATLYSDTGLTAETKYYYRVRASKTTGAITIYSAWSASANATTDAE